MKKLFSFFFRLTLYSTLCVILLVSAIFCFSQTSLGKKQMSVLLSQIAWQKGFDLSFTPVEGNLPWNWKIKEIAITKENQSIYIKNLKVKMSFLSLVERQPIFKKIRVDQVVYSYEEGPKPSATLPLFDFKVNSLKIKEVIVENKTQKKQIAFSFESKGKFSPLKKTIQADFFIASEEGSLTLNIRQNREITCFLDGKFSSFTPFGFFFPLDYQGKGYFDGSLRGSWDSFSALLSHEKDPSSLYGTIKASIDSAFFLEKSQNWKINTDFTLHPYSFVTIQSFALESDFIDSNFQGHFGNNISPQLTSSFSIKDLSFLPLCKGAVKGNIDYDQTELNVQFLSDVISVDEQDYLLPKMEIVSRKQGKDWKGTFLVKADKTNAPVEGSSTFSFSPEGMLHIKDLKLFAESAQVQGDLKIYPSKLAASGYIFAHIPDINLFWKSGSGQIGLKATLQNATLEKQDQLIEFDLALRQFRTREFFTEKADVSGKLEKLFSHPSAHMQVEMDDLYYRDALFSKIETEATYFEKKWTLSTHAIGMWEDPFEIQTDFSIQKEDQSLFFTVEKLDSSVLKNEMILKKPVHIETSPSSFKMDSLEVDFLHGYLKASANFSNQASYLKIKGKHIPLDFVSFFEPRLPLTGFSTIDMQFSCDEEKQAEGRLLFLVERAVFSQEDKKDDLQAKGSMQIHLEKNQLQIHSYFVASNQQFFDFSSTAFVDYQTFPPSFRLIKDKPINANLTTEGKVEEIFDFIDLGSNRISGWVSGQLLLSGTPEDPKIFGDIDCTSGTYENYYTGTYLRQIDFKMASKNQNIEMAYFSAKDEEEGTIYAEGNIALSPQEHFPFRVDMHLEKLHVLSLDFVESDFSGDILLEGSLEHAVAKGKLIPEARFIIPNTIPDPIPELPIKFTNMPVTFSTKGQIKNESKHPIALDIVFDAPKKIFVEGKGLQSEWGGSIALKGTTSNMIATGSLHLQRGYYTFSGKKFSLSEGEIVFSHKNSQLAYLNLQGNLTLSDVTVIAVLRGPLLSPQLTFQSIPQMATSEILARVLFNKDLSEISPVQAVQLAQIIISLSGNGGVNVLETIRKSLGIDRFTIVSPSNSADEISVQIGKYIVQGVMVTLSQSMDSSQIIVEVELLNGFILQAETDVEQEGKFSLKWNYNY